MKDKYYYFTTCTKNIMFERGKQYVCLSNLYMMEKGKVYTLLDFKNGDWSKPLIFKDHLNSLYRMSIWDVGHFMSVNKYRKYKLNKLNNV